MGEATTEEDATKNQAAIWGLIDGYVKAICTKDIDGVMSAYAPDIVAFDACSRCNMPAPRRSGNPGKKSLSATRARYNSRFATWASPRGMTLRSAPA